MSFWGDQHLKYAYIPNTFLGDVYLSITTCTCERCVFLHNGSILVTLTICALLVSCGILALPPMVCNLISTTSIVL